MDRLPKPAPFKVGTRLRYKGTTETYTYDIRDGWENKKVIPLCVPGMEVVVAEARPGRRGTLIHMRDSDGPMFWDDTGEPILDETSDGYSVYFVEAYQSGKKQGRCIHRDGAKEWEKLA